MSAAGPTTVLVVEDDDAIRANIARLLTLEGYEVSSAADGNAGLARARAWRPEVVISDVNMPGLDGFALVEALRADPVLASASVLLLTALDDRASMRRGMSAGADDYLAKPFTRDELLQALDGLRRKRGHVARTVAQAVQAREEDLRRAFAESLDGRTLRNRLPLQPPEGAVADQELAATVLFCEIRNFTSLAERLDSAEVAELLTEFFERGCAPLLRAGGRHLKFVGDGLVAVFVDASDRAVPGARRAVSAALGVVLATHAFRGWLQQRFGERGLPPFAVGVALHAGEVTICRLGTGEVKETLPIGETVHVAARLQSAGRELGWTVVASDAVLRQAGAGVQTAAITAVQVRGRDAWVEVAEVVGLDATEADGDAGLATLAGRAEELREAVQANSALTARAVKGALRKKLSTLKDHRFAADDAPLRLKGYRITRKLAGGGMTEVYLAVREADGLPVVLKVLQAGAGRTGASALARFIQEYALVSRIAHPHVVRIYDQGFTDDHAYIAMEYFEGGDLRGELRGPLGRERALDVLAQVARALEAVHAQGIIHRDLKPENVMRRTDGSVALADFGVAKSLQESDVLGLTQTRHGEVVGTPCYLSPEQAAGGAITPATDLYSLGVMFHEMLTGSRPYSAESLDLLLARHVTAPVPQLPAEFGGLQPILDKLMAKAPEARHSSARALLDQLAALPLLRTAPSGRGGSSAV